MSGILGYARVSTGDQDVAGQTMRLEQAGAIKVFTDVRSGKSMDRPGLTELLAYVRPGDTLAVVRLDRLGRSLGELLTIVTALKERGIALLSLEEKLDTSSAAGELVFHVFGAIAHFERRLIAERTKDGIAAARAKGKLPGRRPLDPEKASAALMLVVAGTQPTEAAQCAGASQRLSRNGTRQRASDRRLRQVLYSFAFSVIEITSAAITSLWLMMVHIQGRPQTLFDRLRRPEPAATHLRPSPNAYVKGGRLNMP